MKQRTAKEAYCESQNGRELTKFQQRRYYRKLNVAKKLIVKRAFEMVDAAVGKGEHKATLEVYPREHYREGYALGVSEPVPAIPRFFTEYEINRIHEETLDYLEEAFKSFGYKVELTDLKTKYWQETQVVGVKVRLEWSGKYGDACGES